MSDGWLDRRGRHLINFLVNNPEGTFFLELADVSLNPGVACCIVAQINRGERSRKVASMHMAQNIVCVCVSVEFIVCSAPVSSSSRQLASEPC